MNTTLIHDPLAMAYLLSAAVWAGAWWLVGGLLRGYLTGDRR